MDQTDAEQLAERLAAKEAEIAARARVRCLATNYVANFLSAVDLARPEDLAAVAETIERMKADLVRTWLVRR